MTAASNPAKTHKREDLRAPVILLIEDTLSLQMVYRTVLTNAGHSVATASTATEGLDQFLRLRPRIVLLDLMLPDRDGLDLMREMLKEAPQTSVIVITANGSINKAVEAMRAGAHEFLVKPFDEPRFIGAVENALKRGTPANASNRSMVAGDGAFIGSSPAMALVQRKITSVATSMATVFITGESGTGKELCALAVHQQSPRATGPFIALNCGAIPADLLESEVFGHMKGSFTGAISDKLGAAAAADGGTLFLDEVCEMLPALQTKLLRFLQTSTVQPVGATRPNKVDVRIVCATNRDPMEAVRLGQFREDLYYRLFVVPIHMPPLRDRDQDVIEIAEAALLRYSEEEGRQFRGLSEGVKEIFRALPWPGNIRQLLNVMRNVVVLFDAEWVEPFMLPEDLGLSLQPQTASAVPTITAPEAGPTLSAAGLLGKTLAQIERTVIETTLEYVDGSVPKAARMLDISPSTLYRKLESWGRKGTA